jgi:hypothetical protein
VTLNDGFTRFLVHKNQFRVSGNGRVTPPALMPWTNPKTGRLETSTHRTDGLQPARVWTLGYQYVETPDRRIKARGYGTVALVINAGLRYEVNGKPYPRHADIIDWPNAPKHVQMMAATNIANGLTLQLDPR